MGTLRTQAHRSPNMADETATDNMNDTDAVVNMDKLYFCGGFCCCYSGLYCDCPEMLGCAGESELCCIVEKFCCRIGTAPLLCTPPEPKPNKAATCCQLGCVCCSCGCKSPETCCQQQVQLLCLVSAAALPCTDEVPFTFSCLPGCSIMPKFGCCMKMSELIKEATGENENPGGEGGPPPGDSNLPSSANNHAGQQA